MTLRIVGAVSVLAAVVLLGAISCTNSKDGLTTSGSNSSEFQDTKLNSTKAQDIIRTLVDPSTKLDIASALINSDDPSWGEKIHGFAESASRGGYSPDKFNVKSVAAHESDKALVKMEVSSPHSPAPVTVTYNFERVEGTWKLSESSGEALVGMGAAHSRN